MGLTTLFADWPHPLRSRTNSSSEKKITKLQNMLFFSNIKQKQRSQLYKKLINEARANQQQTNRSISLCDDNRWELANFKMDFSDPPPKYGTADAGRRTTGDVYFK